MSPKNDWMFKNKNLTMKLASVRDSISSKSSKKHNLIHTVIQIRQLTGNKLNWQQGSKKSPWTSLKSRRVQVSWQVLNNHEKGGSQSLSRFKETKSFWSSCSSQDHQGRIQILSPGSIISKPPSLIFQIWIWWMSSTQKFWKRWT